MRYRAFGVDIESAFNLRLLPPALENGSQPGLELTTVSRRVIDGLCPPSDGRCVEFIQHPGGEVGLQTDHFETVGYRMDAGDYGLYHLSADGSTAFCAPPDVETWRRERFLIARVIPMASLIQGHEVLHASGVEIDGTAIGFVGHSGAGKTSLAVRLALRGAPILTDDLLAISPFPEWIGAHPGTMEIGIRHQEHDLLRDDERAKLAPLFERGGKVYGRVATASGPLPLRIIYLLERRQDVRELKFVAQIPPDPKALLGAAFFHHLELTRGRLLNQLELCSRLGQEVSLFRAVVPLEVGAEVLAEKVENHARAQLAHQAA